MTSMKQRTNEAIARQPKATKPWLYRRAYFPSELKTIFVAREGKIADGSPCLGREAQASTPEVVIDSY